MTARRYRVELERPNGLTWRRVVTAESSTGAARVASHEFHMEFPDESCDGALHVEPVKEEGAE